MVDRAAVCAVIAICLVSFVCWNASGRPGEVELEWRGRIHSNAQLENRAKNSPLHYNSPEEMHSWHQAHAPTGEQSFSVMHASPVKPAASDIGVNELLNHANSMLRDDNEQINDENKKFADSKPKGMYKDIEKEKHKEDYDREADRAKMHSKFSSEEAQREDRRSHIDTQRSNVAEELAKEYEDQIDERKAQLNAENVREGEEGTETRAAKMKEEAASYKAKALQDARLAGMLDDKADESDVRERDASRQERHSLVQLKQLHDQVEKAEAEAKRARADAHSLRAVAAGEVESAKKALTAAERLIASATQNRQIARTKRAELAQARLALKTASKVEETLRVKAAQYTGKAKLDLLQSTLLKKAAKEHHGKAHALRREAEEKRESIEQLKHDQQHAQNLKHEAEVSVQRLEDKLALEKRREERRLKRAQAAAARAETKYEAAQTKYKDDKEVAGAEA